MVDLWGGYADKAAARPWKSDTMAIAFSSTKAVCALSAQILVHRGLLDYDAKVVQYWPEFRKHGKEVLTVRQLLSHRAGLAVIDDDKQITRDVLRDPKGKAMSAILEDQVAPSESTLAGRPVYRIQRRGAKAQFSTTAGGKAPKSQNFPKIIRGGPWPPCPHPLYTGLLAGTLGFESWGFEKPNWELREENHGYHAITYGWLVDQLVRRVDPKHRSLGTFVRQEITQPHSLSSSQPIVICDLNDVN